MHSYWETQMELLDDHPPLDLYDRDWVVHTRSEERAPARIGSTASVHRSLISHGCIISGTVEHSVLSPGVRVDPGAIVRDSVIMFDTHIRAGAVVDRAIIDKEVNVGPNAIVGTGNDFDTRQRGRAGAPQHRHHRRGQARRSSRPPPASGATSASPATCARPTSSRSASRAAAASSVKARRAARPEEGLTGSCPVLVTYHRRGHRRRLAGRARARAHRPWRARRRQQLGPAPRRTATRRHPRHAHPGPGSAMLLWVHFAPPLNDTLPGLLPPVPALERRAALREVRALGRRPPDADLRAASSAASTGTRWAWPSRGCWRSAT